ncbi:hypothetical protein ACOME3_009085 [Neoechinorhynchus agilis]
MHFEMDTINSELGEINKLWDSGPCTGRDGIKQVEIMLLPRLQQVANFVQSMVGARAEWKKISQSDATVAIRYLLFLSHKLVQACIDNGQIFEVLEFLMSKQKVNLPKFASTISESLLLISKLINDLIAQADLDTLTTTMETYVNEKIVNIQARRLFIWLYEQTCNALHKFSPQKLLKSLKQLTNTRDLLKTISGIRLPVIDSAHEALWFEAINAYLNILKMVVLEVTSFDMLLRYTEMVDAASFLTDAENLMEVSDCGRLAKIEQLIAKISALNMDMRMKLTELDKDSDEIEACSAH